MGFETSEKATRTIMIGYSPCPNDTFIFYGLVHQKIRIPGIKFQEQLQDVETLNRMALGGSLDITKVSYHALGHLRDTYALLRSGGALGRGCGPLVVARSGTKLKDIKNNTIAIPGELTTAFLLLRLYDPSITNVEVMAYDRIMQAVTEGAVVAGLIIHESRFTYPLYNLEKLLDLGEWWEGRTGMPIPLGGILGKRSLGRDTLLKIETAIQDSIRYAHRHTDDVLAYCKQFAQEIEAAVMKSHIDLYVNDFTRDLGQEGIAAVQRLLTEAESRTIFPPSGKPLLAEEALEQ